ncbi:MAG: RND family transporter [Desulfobacteraceae bacterium]|nr:RND family transporter [Desulfobacteraceae bacterium]MBU4000699.1 MMPL family transporter [Pseudomonadota bacterium]MBU4054747.1 MMPL family transporter [Pseudomonadota bacterium]
MDSSPSTGNTAEKAPLMERVIFSKRRVFLLGFFLITVFLGFQASKLRWEANFKEMIPSHNPYIINYLDNEKDLRGLGDSVRIVVETTGKDIFTTEYLEVLQKINDEVFFIPGVDRSALSSLWTPQTRWTEVTEEGFDGGPVIPDTYDGSPESIEHLKINVMKAGIVGSMVANNFKSSIVFAPLLSINPETKEPLNYRELSQQLETLVRDKYESDTIRIHITGFAKIVGELIEGSARVFIFFIIAFVILLLLLFYNSRCWRSTLMRAISSSVAVIWMMGLIYSFGYGLNPYSMLVPFLMFALGVSHGIQMFNAMAHEMVNGADKLAAARLAYRAIYIPGLSALLTDAIGFATLFVIQIGVIQDIAIGASIGVVVVAFTDLMLLPVLMSYSGISERTIQEIINREDRERHPLWVLLAKLTRKRAAFAAILVAVLAFGTAHYIRQGLKVGDLDPGAPELRPDSRYNLDNAFINENYKDSSDVFVVMVKTGPDECGLYHTMVAMDRLQWQLENLPAVQSTQSIEDATKMVLSGFNEGNLKWMSLTRIQNVLSNALFYTPPKFRNSSCSLQPIWIYLNDHKAETLQQVVDVVNAFAAENNSEKAVFLMAAGSAGIEAATNIEVKKAHIMMTILVYVVVFLVCAITFRSILSALCVVLPLYLTSVMCEAAMTLLGIGIKVATLPVIAVGVGIGVDYGIYIFNKLRYYINQGENLENAYYHTLNTTGRAVTFTGITLSIGVATWAFSPIKFQADMGILLTFMFLVNMIGALVLLPAIASLLLRFKGKRVGSDELLTGP